MAITRITLAALTLGVALIGCPEDPEPGTFGEDPSEQARRNELAKPAASDPTAPAQGAKPAADQPAPSPAGDASDAPPPADKSSSSASPKPASADQPASAKASAGSPERSSLIPAALSNLADAFPGKDRSQTLVPVLWRDGAFIEADEASAATASALRAGYASGSMSIVSEVDEATHERKVVDNPHEESCVLYALSGSDRAAIIESIRSDLIEQGFTAADEHVMGAISIQSFVKERQTAYFAQHAGLAIYALETDGEPELNKDARGGAYGARQIILLAMKYGS